MKTSDVPIKPILEYLLKHQDPWVCLWGGHFKGKDDTVTDIYYAMPDGLPKKLPLAVMRSFLKKGLVDGCPCGCRGDWTITKKGILYLKEGSKV
jgi:hypothetical protein